MLQANSLFSKKSKEADTSSIGAAASCGTAEHNDRAAIGQPVKDQPVKGGAGVRSYGDTDRVMYIVAFLVPFVISLSLYAGGRVWPFGEQCFLKTDMYHQYAPFFAEFRHKLLTGGSLFFSWDIGLGVNFLPIFAYYLASPVNWLVILAGEKYVIEFMMLIMTAKLGLASLSFTYYLRRHADRKDAGYAFFGILYALSGYMCAYYWNLMWLDCIILFPLILCELEGLVSGKRAWLYSLLLGLCIISNYYISIMICAFLVLWFIARNILDFPPDPKTFLIRCAKFAAASLIAGAVAAILLLPAYHALMNSASASSKFPSKVTEYFSIVKMLARMLPAVETEQVLAHWPNIYSGTFFFILFPLYLMTRKIGIREKAVFITFAIFFLASFSFNFLDYIWHGFHYPNSLPCRQSFIFVFIVLFMCMRAYEHKASYTRKELGIALASAFIFFVYSQEGADGSYFKPYTFYMAMLLAAVYVLILRLWNRRRIGSVGAFVAVLCVLGVEVAANCAVTSFTTSSRTFYTKDNKDIRALTGEVEEMEADNSFYRYEKIARLTKNDGAWLNFPSVSIFSSTADKSCTKLFTKLGCEASTNAYSITGSTPLVDMLFSVKYALSGAELENAYGRAFVDSTDTTWLYENLSTLPIGYIVPRRLSENWAFDFDNPVTVQNSICDACGAGQVLKELVTSGTESKDGYSVTIEEDGEYFAFVTNTAVKEVSVSWQGKKKKFENVDRKYLLELGECKNGDVIKFTSETKDQKMDVKVCRFDYDALEELCNSLYVQSLSVISFDDTHIEGAVRCDPAAYGYDGSEAELVITTPYDEGWRAYVDGVETETYEGFGEALLCLKVPEGTHSIRLKFTPKGLREGLLVSAIGVLMLLGLFLLERREK